MCECVLGGQRLLFKYIYAGVKIEHIFGELNLTIIILW